MNYLLRWLAHGWLVWLLSAILLGAPCVGAADLFPTNAPVGDPVPRRGGTLRLALPTDVSSLDPARAFDTISMQFLMLVYQGLVEYDDGVNLLPGLAADWNLSVDRKTYTFHLRPGARFSNGREVEAADFVYSLERTLNPKTAAPTESYFEGIAGTKDFREGKAAHIAGLQAPERYTLTVQLAAPDPTFLYVLALPGGLVVPHEEVERLGAAFETHPVGTGPYVLTEWHRGFNLGFARNPRYPRADRQYLDAIQVLIGGDTTLHLMMFEGGELDIAEIDDNPGIPIPDFLRIERSPRWHNLVQKMPVAATEFLSLNVELPPFDDLRVRQAMNYAINKEKLVRLMHGMDMPAKGILPTTMPGFNTNLVGYPFDPAKARRLLAESGHPDGFAIKLWYPSSINSPVPDAIQFDLAQVGIKAELNPVSFASFLDSVERRHTVQCSYGAWSQDYPDPSDFLDVMFNGNRITEEGCQNNSFYNNPAVNKLLAEAADCPDSARRLKLYQVAEQTIVTDAPYVPLDQPYTFALHQPWLHGVKLHPVLYFRFERMWLDK
jgi:ABC-type transport system substrate-binding protein